jgi:RimJ/RimL family protein N-acetyltransferase
MTVLLQTERLRLRPFTANDVDNILRVTSDAETMRYIGTGATDDRAAAEKRLARYLRYPTLYPGLGWWAAEAQATNDFIGWFALIYIPNTAEVEVGYLLVKSAWGRGFATEGARTVLTYGFREVGLNRIVAIAQVSNRASQNVMKKIGLKDCGIGHYYSRDVAYFVGERLENA